MKFFAAALALSSALIAPVHGVVDSSYAEVDTCDGQWEADRITKLDFYNSTVETNTLHVDGGELRFGNIGTFKSETLDLVVTVTSGNYTNITQVWVDKEKGPSGIGDPNEMNGKTRGQYFGNINLQTVEGLPKSGEGNFRFCIVKSGTNTPQKVERFSWTTYDTDQRRNNLREKMFIDVSDCSSYQLTNDTEIEVSCEDGSDLPCGAGIRTKFLSTVRGTGGDNPTTPDDLSELQLGRSIQFNFEDTDCWDITYDHFCEFEQVGESPNPNKHFCNSYTGGNFLFAGSSEAITERGECITMAPTPQPTLPPVAPTDSPTPEETKPPPTTDSLCGEEIDVCVAIDNSGSICSEGTPRLCDACNPNQPCAANGDLSSEGTCCGNYNTVSGFAVDYINSLGGKGSVSVVKFGSLATVASPQGTGADAVAAIGASSYTGGYTNTEQAITKCTEQLAGTANPVIVLVTDGTPTACARSDPTKFKTIFQGDCNTNNCPQCPNGDPANGAEVVAGQAAAAGITIVPVIVSSVSSNVDQLEALARCPVDSTDCDIDDYKGLVVGSVDQIGSLLQDLVGLTECPIVCAQDVEDCDCGDFVSRDPENNCEFPACPEVTCPLGAIDCGEGLDPVFPDPANCCAIPDCPTYAPTGAPTEKVCAQDVKDCDCDDFVSRDPANNCEFPACPVRVCTEDAKQCGEGLGFVVRDPALCCEYPDCPTYAPTVAPTEKVCTQDVKDCDCGGSVGRNPDLDCEYDPCPQPVCGTGAIDCGEGLDPVFPDPENCCAIPDCPTYAPTSSPSASPTEGHDNTPPTPPTPAPDTCPEDVEVLYVNGVTEIPVANAVIVTKQDTSSVEVRLTNAWTSAGQAVDSIFYEYKINGFDEKCYEAPDIDGGSTYDNITIQCLHSEPYARLDICVADSGGALSDDDNAEVPKCCEPDLKPGADVVCYKLVVWCETRCIDAVQRRSLRGAADIVL
jgi:hypothetical protein